MNLESANIILRTSSVALGSDKDSNRTNITWRNINLKMALGSLYDKYTKFKICLTSVGNANTSNIANITDRMLNINMTGLMWINQTYDTSTNSNTNNVIISTAIFNSTSGFSINYTGEIGWVFQKPVSNNVDINIYFTRISDGTQASGINYGETVFCFSIYGIE